MIRKGIFVLFGFLLLFAGCKKASDVSPDPLSGTYEVVTDDSVVSFTSIKNHDIPVGGTFGQITGSIKISKDASLDNTTGEVNVDLTSLDTENKERDDNILIHFFRAMGDNVVSKKMSFSIEKMKFNEKDVSPLPVGTPKQLRAIGKLSVYESSVTHKLNLTVTRLGEDRVLVTTRDPIAFEIDKFKMGDPLKKMMEVCGHGAISNVVPAQFYLVFEKPKS